MYCVQGKVVIKYEVFRTPKHRFLKLDLAEGISLMYIVDILEYT